VVQIPPDVLSSVGFTKEQQALAEAVGRLVAPSSDLATWTWLRQRTALPELVMDRLSQVGKDAVYEIADLLLAHQFALETALHQRESLLFPQLAHVFLYDLTNVYMEGTALGNDLAKFGRSKEKRSDYRLVTLALLVDEYGFPLYSTTFTDLCHRLPFVGRHRAITQGSGRHETVVDDSGYPEYSSAHDRHPGWAILN
jgi:hypothetical protein